MEGIDELVEDKRFIKLSKREKFVGDVDLKRPSQNTFRRKRSLRQRKIEMDLSGARDFNDHTILEYQPDSVRNKRTKSIPDHVELHQK